MSKLQQAAEFFRMNDFAQAKRLYQEVLVNQPNCGQAYLGMGIIALKVQQYDKAVTFLTKSCELLPNDASPLIHLSEAFNGVHYETDGLTVLEYAVVQLPKNAIVHYHLGLQYIILGKLEKAEQSFKTVIQISQDPIVSYALMELSRLDKKPEQYLSQLNSRLIQSQGSSQERIVVHYALGNIFDALQNYPQAWEHFKNANLLQEKLCNFKTIELKDFFQSIKSIVTTKVLSTRREISIKDKVNEIVPIFILGLPRTGSTLLEHILSEHQDIASAGEVSYLSQDVANYLFSQSKQHFPYSIEDMTSEQLGTAAQLYLNRLAGHANGKRYVIDKLPANFQSIGLIYKLFPNAKVIHLKRILPDVALSIFRNNFAQNEPYFCCLSEFKQYHSLYADLMQYWNSKLPEFIYEIDYEQLVLDKTGVINGIFEFCGLSPQKDGLKVNDNLKVVKTLSNIEVRRPINTKRVKQWHNYAEHLNLFKESEHVD